MTNPVEPDAAPSVPEFPALGDPSFNSKAYTWGSWMPTLVTWISGVVTAAYENALSAFENATASSASAAASEASSLASAGSSNFQGDWSTLTGPLNRPASVAHAGRTWLLLADLADVTSAVPGVSASWRAYDVLLPVVHVLTATQVMTSGYHYSVEYAGQVTMTMPPLVDGAMVYITISNNRTDTILLRNNPADSFMGKPPDDFTLIRRTTRCLRGLATSWRGL